MLTRQDEQRTTQSGPGGGEGRRRGKRGRGQGKGAPARARVEGSGEKEDTEKEKENTNTPGRRTVPSIPPRPSPRASKKRGDDNAPCNTADGEGESGNVFGYFPKPEDLRLPEVYGDWVHGNPGTHLDDGIA